MISDSFEELKNTMLKNRNRLMIAQININSLRNKFELPVRMMHHDLDTLLICETKIACSVPNRRFYNLSVR